MKKFVLIMSILILFLNGSLFSQNATINGSAGGSDQYVCESLTIDLISGITVGVKDSVQWIRRIAVGGGGYGSWSFVDTTDTIAAPSGGAIAGNLYQYKLTVYQSGNQFVATVTLHVNVSPSANLLSTTIEICAGEDVTFSASAGMSNYDFQINSGSMQSTAVDTFSTTVLNDGDNVTVVVTDGNGCSATSNSITMTVHSLPTITDITYSSAYSSSTSECVGTAVDATITMTGTSPFTVEVYDLVGGNPTNLLFTQSGLTGPTDTYQEPVFGVGAVDEYTVIRDAYCPSVLP